jgi:hypothetical protein
LCVRRRHFIRIPSPSVIKLFAQSQKRNHNQ